MHKIDVNKLLGKNPSRRRKILLEFAKQPSGVANRVMAETLHIDYSDLVDQHLSVFEEFGVIRKCDVVVERLMGRVRTKTEISMKGYRLNHDTNALHKLVAVFNRDPDSQHEFTRSQHYRGMTRDLTQQFEDSIPDNDMWLFARPSDDDVLVVLDYDERTEPLEIEWEYGLTDEDKSSMINALKENWLALKWVVHFISATDDERSSILHQLMESVHNPHTSPAAAHATGYTKGFCLGMDTCQLLIADDKKAMWIKKRMEAEMSNAPFGNHINWGELFHQLDHFNSNYPYLFD